ncbi:hypothetical protein HYH02_012305 [Chlamydomonas schloesseri]|uniref:Cytochrome P450 n=1 Tax=Chlamydomonas schloesseri TaxID=2026947 RepID=A0A835SZB0_9CHLO|nr:hypothetical protein HYH02_012305 [Chlamydomonas schloesseri]|eukprot:KAG2434476.1 hypothetical protein HYH02_012305 [Chlamydomonas schloesseri]
MPGLAALLAFIQTPLGALWLAGTLVITWLGWYPLRRYAYRKFPGPFGLPFLGNLPQIAAMDTTAFLTSSAVKYGPVCKVWFGTRPWVLINDPELVRRHAFRWAARPGDFASFLHVMTGENRAIDRAGVVLAEGEAWRRTRRVFEASIIHPASLAAHVPAMRRCLERFGRRLERHALSGEPLDMAAALGDLMLAAMGQIAYGVDFGCEDGAGASKDNSSSIGGAGAAAGGGDGSSTVVSELVAAIRDVFETMQMDNATAYLPLQLMFPSLEPFWQWAAHNLPDAKQTKAMRARSKVAEVSRLLMEQWQANKAAAAVADGDKAGDKGAGDKAGGFKEVGGGISSSSFMAAMMEGRRGAPQDERLSDIEVISQGFTFLVAGYETTSAATALALFLLATHPEAAARLVAEVDSVLGGGGGGGGGGGQDITPELLAERLPYTDAVLKEALRLHPGITFLVREAKEDVDLGQGRVAPKGSTLCLATHAVQHDPAIWPQPEAFRPERFLPDSGGRLGPLGDINAHAWAPFGMGPRMCVGHKLAMMASKATLVALFQRFAFELHSKQPLPLKLKTGLTYGPADGVWMTRSDEWSRLSEGLIQKIAAQLHPNEVAIGLKLLNRETARCLKEYRRIQLSQLLTPAPSWAEGKEPVHVASTCWPSAAFVAHWGRPEPWRALTLRQRRRLLSLAANSGCAASLAAALAHCGCSLTSEVAVAAVLGGSVAAVETLLVREGGDCSRTALEEVAAEAGHLEALQWLLQARGDQLIQTASQMVRREDAEAPKELAVAVAACRGGHAHILAWLQEQDMQQRQQEQQQAEQQQQQAGQQQQAEPQGQHQELEQQQGQQQEQQQQLLLAGLGVVVVPLVHGPLTLAHPKAVPFLAGAAAVGGHVGLLEQLLPRLEPIPTGAACTMLCKVAGGCPLEVLQRVCRHLYQGDAEPDGSTKQSLAFAAAVSPTPDWEAKLDWVLLQQPNAHLPGHPNPANSITEDQGVLTRAAGALPDWLQRLQALHARRVPLPPLHGLAVRAAAVGDVAALRWLLQACKGEGQGEGQAAAPLSEELVTAAVRGGHVPVLAELRERGCVFGESHVAVAANSSKPDAVFWLLEQQQPLQPPVSKWPPIFNALVRKGADLALLRRLHERHGAGIEIDAIAQDGSVAALEWAVAAMRERPADGQGAKLSVQYLPQYLQRRMAWREAALRGNLAAADWAAQLLAENGHAPPVAPRAGANQFVMAVSEGDTFGALRWWLRQRQEGHGLTQLVPEGQGGEMGWEERVGALADAEWRAVLELVASSAFPPPAYPGEWNFSCAQWAWLLRRRLQAAAAAAEAAGAGPEQVQGAVAAARAEAEELARKARRPPSRFDEIGGLFLANDLALFGQNAAAAAEAPQQEQEQVPQQEQEQEPQQEEQQGE